MQFTTIVLSLVAAVAAQETVWVTETVVGTDCAPTYTGLPTTYPPANLTTTVAIPTYTMSTVVSVNTTTGGVPEVPTSTPTETLGPGSAAGNTLPASGFALAGAIAAIVAIIA
ncbi:hypothetical protein H072_7163 [Dactylellina haptotyla CBS 200.50]|uniref:Uncharacterized protein n=1 Tax=Dactylellina haptotyla (strain CBS 200.50) TaxID=1284197 RepID=S8A890_DACHA|nr:hypothetical protein H072_7163 [Dactylellina haptotyla CBS 200.50]